MTCNITENKTAPDPARHVAARFDIPSYRYLDSDGRALAPLQAFAGDYDHIRKLYRMMLLVRSFDQRAIALQRTGQLGTYASCLGQEAIGTALGDAMAAEDVLLPSYRETPALLMRGVAMHELLLYWGGDERGMAYGKVPHDFPICIPIATQAPHAVGVASAFKLRGEQRVAVSVFGDGASSKGDFYEALNLAGIWRLPVLFIIVNNQWAISVPRDAQSGAETLAQKAIAGGLGCEQVDGNDLIAMRERIASALAHARAGEPWLIEAKTYRLCDHTTADDASRYRDKVELERHRALEPVVRIRRYLEQAGQWDQRQEDELKTSNDTEVENAVNTYLAAPPPSAQAMFDHLYAVLPESLHWQLVQATEQGHGCG